MLVPHTFKIKAQEFRFLGLRHGGLLILDSSGQRWLFALLWFASEWPISPFRGPIFFTLQSPSIQARRLGLIHLTCYHSALLSYFLFYFMWASLIQSVDWEQKQHMSSCGGNDSDSSATGSSLGPTNPFSCNPIFQPQALLPPKELLPFVLPKPQFLGDKRIYGSLKLKSVSSDGTGLK